MANYCRSPVAEYIMKHQDKKLNVVSAGLNPIAAAGMDLRSQKFLKDKKIKYEVHRPKLFNTKMANDSKIIFALDHLVLIRLNEIYKKYMYKIKLFTILNPNIKINDPYRLDEEEYEKNMEKIWSEVPNLFSKYS